jgi:hypothetical protein
MGEIIYIEAVGAQQGVRRASSRPEQTRRPAENRRSGSGGAGRRKARKARKSNRLNRSIGLPCQGVKALRRRRDRLQRVELAIEPRSDRRKNADHVEGSHPAGTTGAAGTVTVSGRPLGTRKPRSPGNALIVVVIGLRIDRREAPAGILLGRLLAVPTGRTAGGGERWWCGRLTDVVQDLADCWGVGDERDDPHRRPAGRAAQRKPLVWSGQQPGAIRRIWDTAPVSGYRSRCLPLRWRGYPPRRSPGPRRPARSRPGAASHWAPARPNSGDDGAVALG